MKSYLKTGFLISNWPYGGNPLEKNCYPLRYSDIISEQTKSEIQGHASLILSQISSEEICKIMVEGHESWREFGLELKKHYKTSDSLFKLAVEKTDSEIIEVSNGNYSFDPKLLLRRYLVKLLSGLEVRRQYSRMTKIPLSRIRVFDTPEYLPAAKLLSKYLKISMSNFSFPSGSPLIIENQIREILKLKPSSKPLVSTDFVKFNEAVIDIKEKIDQGISSHEIRSTVNAELKKATRKIKRRRVYLGGMSSIPGINEVFEHIATGVTTPDEIILSVVAPILLSYLISEQLLDGTLTEFSPAAKFIAKRQMINNFNPKQRVTSIWINHIFSMARRIKERPVTELRIQRQLMKPWAENAVWYDNHLGTI